MNNEQEELITFSEAARIRKVTPQAIDSLVKSGRLEFIERGGKKFLWKVDVENYEKGKAGRRLTNIRNMDFKKKLNTLLNRAQNPKDAYPSYLECFLAEN